MGIKFEVYIAFRQSADSWTSHPELPTRAFTSKEEAEVWVSEQPGYGLNIDWFVKPIPLFGKF
jgi:hypothetical protein